MKPVQNDGVLTANRCGPTHSISSGVHMTRPRLKEDALRYAGRFAIERVKKLAQDRTAWDSLPAAVPRRGC